MKNPYIFTALVSLMALVPLHMQADPCGMVPPIYSDNESPITRIGLQKTYVFHKNGVETFVIKPGFQGKVDNFGMLIPFPNPPAIRKVADATFDHLVNAIDPPEVVVYAGGIRRRGGSFGGGGMGGGGGLSLYKTDDMARNEVRVISEEAVGMYEVATLAAGSPESLKRWMEENKYKYPEGMDKVAEDYIQDKWCFVAVKTKVGAMQNAEPKPGLRKTDTQMPDGSVFDGHVQAMGFRFQSEDLVVPMRLSAFNPGDMRNVVYILSDEAKKIRNIPEEYVVRQVSGKVLMNNLTEPLPLRVIGGTANELTQGQRDQLPQMRDPSPKNGIAKELFTSDLQAVATKTMSLAYEEKEKELLRIGEHFGLRGPEIDQDNRTAVTKLRDSEDDKYFKHLRSMTLTVVDGDFPREVLAKQNLSFDGFRMARTRNNPQAYDAKNFGPGMQKSGRRYEGKLSFTSPPPTRTFNNVYGEYRLVNWIRPASIPAVIGLIMIISFVPRRRFFSK